MNKLKNVLIDIACLAFLSSTIMDSYLWITIKYEIPCWTIAAMSSGMIILLQVIKRMKW